MANLHRLHLDQALLSRLVFPDYPVIKFKPHYIVNL